MKNHKIQITPFDAKSNLYFSLFIFHCSFFIVHCSFFTFPLLFQSSYYRLVARR